jgi:hypothetical protein
MNKENVHRTRTNIIHYAGSKEKTKKLTNISELG